jgi:hypothetical protein
VCPDLESTAEALGRPAVVVIDGGMVPLMESRAEEVAVQVTRSLR